MSHLQSVFYLFKPIISRRLQIVARQALGKLKLNASKNIWPIFKDSAKKPKGWKGWPEEKQFSLVLTHDVDTIRGRDRCLDLAQIDSEMGFKSSFNFVPERYPLSTDLPKYLADQKFEVGVHGLYHDGRLYASKKIFLQRAVRINYYLEQWGAVGFRSPAMHNNLEWTHYLNVEYDASTFDTDPFEPQPKGTGTIFPFWVNANGNGKGFVELPYTLPQDFTLFVILNQNNTKIWEDKLAWIAKNGGMALLNTHPDYMNFENNNTRYDEYPAAFYRDFLELVRSKYAGSYWNALPREVADYYKNVMVDFQAAG